MYGFLYRSFRVMRQMLIVFGFVLVVPFVSGIIGIFKTKH